MFYSTMMMGSLMTISTFSWLTAWAGLEMNLLSILPLMKTEKKTSTETMIKYFMTQAIASSLLLFSIIIFTNSEAFSSYNKSMTEIFSLILTSSLLLKMGAAPLHFWLPEVASGLSWNLLFILLTWQKLAPMILLINTINNMNFMYTIIIFSSMIGSLLGLNQICLRKMMAYSSINHMGWMISALLISYNTWLMYFIVYSIINYSIITMMNVFNLNNLVQLSNLFNFNKNLKFMFMMNFFSLGGVPPFLGFLPKWVTINQLINNNLYILTILLILMSLISLYFYARMSFSSLTFLASECLINKPYQNKNFLLILVNSLSLMGLTMFSLIYYLI
uniref:NADH-ubiquinone oxidoreductase chain 2 n=1 Tax=Hylastes opacus TaxID=1002010 RepID=A0A343A5B8_9CUCU|nr:NADH dehydrogenase subunit 2 [Hylastes opacus]